MRTTSTLRLSTYNCKLVLIITDQIPQVVNNLYKKYKIPGGWDVEAEGVMFSPSMHTYYLLIDNECLTHNTIAHEAFHVVHRIMEDRAISDEESGAWIAGHVSEFIYKSLKKKKLTIEHG
jgi:hypothetical protein